MADCGLACLFTRHCPLPSTGKARRGPDSAALPWRRTLWHREGRSRARSQALYPFRYKGIFLCLAEPEGGQQPLEVGALQPEGLGRRRVIALGLRQRLTQEVAAKGRQGGMIRQALERRRREG
jgi:hypothetical protein